MKRKIGDKFYSETYDKTYEVVGTEIKYPEKCQGCSLFIKGSCNGALDETGDCLPYDESNDNFDGNFIFIEV